MNDTKQGYFVLWNCFLKHITEKILYKEFELSFNEGMSYVTLQFQ